MINWQKIGLIFSPDSGPQWMHSHCQLPIADFIKDDVYRVYFASRNQEQLSHIGFVEFSLSQPHKILKVSEKAVLSPGPIGHFDQYGVYPSSIVTYQNKKYLYYIGWIRGAEPPLFYAAIGLAISTDGGETFQRYSSVPIMSTSKFDPCLVTSPQVILNQQGIWEMYYVSGIRWERQNEFLKSYYHIKYAQSLDGIDWKREGKIAIDFKNKEESNIARPSTIRSGDIYKMWYSYVENNQGCRIGYAESKDNKNWVRKDDLAGILPSKSGFDSDIICYPCVFKHQNKHFMLYNGNRFGKDGFGLAIEAPQE